MLKVLHHLSCSYLNIYRCAVFVDSSKKSQTLPVLADFGSLDRGPNTGPTEVKHLERGAFENCGALTQVQVPQTLSCSTWTPRRPSAMKTAIRVLVLVSSADTRRAMMLAIDTAVLGVGNR